MFFYAEKEIPHSVSFSLSRVYIESEKAVHIHKGWKNNFTGEVLGIGTNSKRAISWCDFTMSRMWHMPFITHCKKDWCSWMTLKASFVFWSWTHEAIIKMRDENCMQEMSYDQALSSYRWAGNGLRFTLKTRGSSGRFRRTEAGGCAISVLRGRNEWGSGRNDTDLKNISSHFPEEIHHLINTCYKKGPILEWIARIGWIISFTLNP